MDDKVTIIIPTLGRTTELASCLKSIGKLSTGNFDVVVVDQNQSSILDNLISEYSKYYNINHIKVNFTGASKARNIGAAKATGSLLFFMDDDAELFQNTLDLAIGSMIMNNADVVFGRCIDRKGHNSVISFSEVPGFLTLKKHRNMFVESTMLVRTDVFLNYLFDEALGVGTFHGAEEGYDLVLRLLYDSVFIYYDPKIKVYHPQKITNYSDSDIRRVFTYRCGFAKLCKKHQLNAMYYKRLFLLMLYIPYLCLFKRRKARYYIVELCALVVGVMVK